jgi:hypothetical protein
LLGKSFGGGEVGVELEDAGDEGAGFVELAGVAADVSEVYADGASARGAIEGVGPECDGAIEMASLGFDDAEVGGDVDLCGVGAEGVFVEFARFGDVAAALGEKGETVEQDGVFGMFEDGLIEMALGVDGRGGVAWAMDSQARARSRASPAGAPAGEITAALGDEDATCEEGVDGAAELAALFVTESADASFTAPVGADASGGNRTNCAAAPV